MPSTTDVVMHVTTTGITTAYQGRSVFIYPIGTKVDYSPANIDLQPAITALETKYTNRFPNSGWFN